MKYRTGNSTQDPDTQPFTGQNVMARLCRAIDWSETPLGQVELWPASLRSAVQLCLDSPVAMSVWAGPELLLIYNDAYIRLLGPDRHPWALGRSAREVWADVWDRVAADVKSSTQLGEAVHREDQHIMLSRGGDDEAIVSYSFTPIREADGSILGAVTVVHERTREVRNIVAREARYRALFDTIQQGFCVIEVLFDERGCGCDYRFLEVNPAFEQHTGLRYAAGRTVYELVPDLEPSWPALYGRIATTGKSEYFVEHSAAMGRWFEVEAFRVGAPELRRLGLLFTDITPKKQAEEAARKRAEADAFRTRLADALRPLFDPGDIQAEAAQILGRQLGASRVHYATLSSDGRVGEVIRDYSAGVSSVSGAYRLDVYGPDTMNELRDGRTLIVNNVAEDPRLSTDQRERNAARQIGAYLMVPLFKSGRTVAALVVHQSAPRSWKQHEVALVEETAERTWAAVERARSEQELRESESRLARALEIETIGVLFFDTEGAFLDANATFLRMTGQKRAALERGELSWEQVTAPEWLPRTRDALEEIRSTGRFTPYAKQLIRADGSRWWGLVAGTRLRQTECVEFVLDMTESKEAEKALREAGERKDEFLAMLAHELRNPLAAIQNTVGLLSQSTREPASQRWLTILQRQADQLGGMVDDLLDVSRITRGLISLRRELVDLQDVVSNALEAMTGLLEEKGHEVRVNSPREPMMVLGDSVRLEQILANLLTNAAKYTDAGGRIDVDLKSASGYAEVAVRDSGIGMEAQVCARVFELFGQAERSLARSEGGLGVGLTIVRRLVELHGGQIEAHSAGLGQGSEFIVRLPLEPEGKHRPGIASETSPTGSGGKRILLVEDSPDVAETMSTLLTLAGHTVKLAHDGEAALELAESFPADLILIDIGLPGMNGYEVARRLRQNPRTRSAVLAALTGYGQSRDRERSEESGFDAHFVKPIKLSELEEFIASGAPQRREH